MLSATPNPRVLDIGCGVGRNAIAVARELKSSGVVVDCYDVIESAIDMLNQYAEQFGVSENIVGKTIDMDAIEIESNYYDAILAVSVLEHSKSIDSIQDILTQMVGGTKPRGINRVTVSTERRAIACDTGIGLDTRVETPMTKEEVKLMLERTYDGWIIDRLSEVPYREDLTHDGRLVTWTCTDVSFLARKP